MKGNMMTINGYIVKRLHHNVIRVEGHGVVTDIEARAILGIDKAKRQWEILESMWNKI